MSDPCDSHDYTFKSTSTPPTPPSACDHTLTSTVVAAGGSSAVVDNAAEVDTMDLIGTDNGRFVKLSSTSTGNLYATNGRVSVNNASPATVASWNHVDGDPLKEPLPSESVAVTSDQDTLKRVAGKPDADSILLWNKDARKWQTIADYEVPAKINKPLSPKSQVEISGFSADDIGSDPNWEDSVRERVSLKGDGIVVVENISRGAGKEPVAVASVVPTPNDSSATVWLLAYTFGAKYYMVEADTVLGGGKGEDGEDGLTPYIGANGNWFIGTTDTGVKAAGEDGLTPHIEPFTGNWFLGTVDTGVKAAGEDGTDGADGVDGTSPHIGANGNWFIGTTDTGVLADAATLSITTTTTTVTRRFSATANPKVGVTLNPTDVTALMLDNVSGDPEWSITPTTGIATIGVEAKNVTITASVLGVITDVAADPSLSIHDGTYRIGAAVAYHNKLVIDADDFLTLNIASGSYNVTAGTAFTLTVKAMTSSAIDTATVLGGRITYNADVDVDVIDSVIFN